ncbi:MAG TPA: SUMF1/EgtB/PvdO family nonheme iron enzyme [Kofleriaceae bacterium]|nr:SUMF1/EgtB/PvdO family nonheme iron enzyme [Kofleriaceae bacterium]
MGQMSVAAMLLLAACGSVKDTGDDAPIDAPESDAPADAPPPTASCVGLAPTCGPGANASCCQAAMVPGGTFFRDYDVPADLYNDMIYPATVSTFVLDTYEVTVGRFRKFVMAGMGTQGNPPGAGTGAHPKLAGSGWNIAWNQNLAVDTAALTTALKCTATYQTWTDAPGANETRPLNCVTWYEAMAFCIWDGGYLPTDLEWGYTASGGSEQRAYPWSKPADALAVDCTYANYNINTPVGTYCVNGITGGTSPVGSTSPKGDGRWGHADLPGSVYEWLLDTDGMYPSPCSDCGNLNTSNNRVIRGGSFGNPATTLRAGFHNTGVPGSRASGLGFRCARSI